MSDSNEVSKAAVDTSTVDIASEPFPLAEVISTKSTVSLLRQSKLWWVTLMCLVLAGWLAWRSLPEQGPKIRIRFPEGHGLKIGDNVRYRGIEVGVVTNVALNERLSGVDVDVMLNPGSGRLDREGTRFWIVRPRLSLTEISDLDTAVGAKYIGVTPGDPLGAHRDVFEGLPAAPPDELADGGLDLILRSDQRHGLSSGSPVTWRGVDAGQVLSVNLSPDARHVDVAVRINRAHRRLVRPSSKFWITSGFAMDVGLTGVTLNAQSLTTILRGGVSFVTPSDDHSADVASGRVFPLAAEPDESWLSSAASVPLIDLELPSTVTIHGTRASSFLGIRRQNEFTQTGLLLADTRGTRLLTAALPVVETDTDAEPALATFHVVFADGEEKKFSSVAVAQCESPLAGTLSIPVSGLTSQVLPKQFRVPSDPEACLIVRSAVVDGMAEPIIQVIDIEQLTVDLSGDFPSAWRISGSDADFRQWHGSPVVATADGRIIGLLLSESGLAVISRFQKPAANVSP